MNFLITTISSSINTDVTDKIMNSENIEISDDYEIEETKYLLDLYLLRLSRMNLDDPLFYIVKELTDNLGVFIGNLVKITKIEIDGGKEYFIVTNEEANVFIGYIL